MAYPMLPQTSPMNPPWIRPQKDGVALAIKVQPRASRSEVVGVLGQELKIRITAPPVDSAANQALIEFIAEKLDCPKGSVTLVRGSTSRSKIVLIRGMAPNDIE